MFVKANSSSPQIYLIKSHFLLLISQDVEATGFRRETQTSLSSHSWGGPKVLVLGLPWTLRFTVECAWKPVKGSDQEASGVKTTSAF